MAFDVKIGLLVTVIAILGILVSSIAMVQTPLPPEREIYYDDTLSNTGVAPLPYDTNE